MERRVGSCTSPPELVESPARASHLVAQATDEDAKPPRTLKVLFALARGGCAIVRPSWVEASRAAGRWVDVERHLAGYGPPRAAGAGVRVRSERIKRIIRPRWCSRWQVCTSLYRALQIPGELALTSSKESKSFGVSTSPTHSPTHAHAVVLL